MNESRERWMGCLIIALLIVSSSAMADSTFVIANPEVDFEIIDMAPFDGFGDTGPFSTYNTVLLGSLGDDREMAEFDISAFSIPEGEVVTSATLEVRINSIFVFGLGVPNGDNPDVMAAYGYVGDGLESIPDFEAGDDNLLDMLDTTNPQVGQVLSFDVTSFVADLVDAGEVWVGLTVAAEEFGGIAIIEGGPYPRLTIQTAPAPTDCEGDANSDNVVDPLDSGYVQARFGCEVGEGDPECDSADQNGDGVVDPLDVGFVLSRFGECE